MQKFVGTARPEHGADVALFVTTCRAFTGFPRTPRPSGREGTGPLQSRAEGRAPSGRCVVHLARP